MLTLRLTVPTATEPRVIRLVKPLTTFGRSPDNDIVVSDPQVKPSHAYFSRGEQDVTIVAVDGDVLVLGKRKSKLKLTQGERIQLGQCFVELATEQAAAPPPIPVSADSDVLSAVRKLHRFSERLLNHYEPEELWTALVDAVVEITQADNGFLVLSSPGMPPRIKLGRAKGQQPVSEPDAKLSDSIVAKVLRTEQPVIVSDACKDAEFQNAQSVMYLRLSSVMCVPLRERGQLLGALYVGSSDVKRLFRSADLEVLTVIAAQAGLLLRNAHLLGELRRDNQRLGTELEQMRSVAIASVGIARAHQLRYGARSRACTRGA